VFDFDFAIIDGNDDLQMVNNTAMMLKIFFIILVELNN
jgi:hypothetical protein